MATAEGCRPVLMEPTRVGEEGLPMAKTSSVFPSVFTTTAWLPSRAIPLGPADVATEPS